MFLLSSLLASHLQALKKTLFRVLLGHLCDTTAFKMCWFLCLKTAKILVLAVHRGLFSPDIHSVGKAPRVEGRKDSLASCSLGTQAQTNQPWREGDGCGALQMWSDLQIDLQRQSAKHRHFVIYLIYFYTPFWWERCLRCLESRADVTCMPCFLHQHSQCWLPL